MSQPDFYDIVHCPYNKSHRVCRGRLSMHLVRCARTAKNANLFLMCPFNSDHRYKAEDFDKHVKECPNRIDPSRYDWTVKPKEEPVKKPPVRDWDDSEENWDNEPEEPTYNPKTYCEKNFFIRKAEGESKHERHQFRANERRRYGRKKNEGEGKNNENGSKIQSTPDKS